MRWATIIMYCGSRLVRSGYWSRKQGRIRVCGAKRPALRVGTKNWWLPMLGNKTVDAAVLRAAAAKFDGAVAATAPREASAERKEPKAAHSHHARYTHAHTSTHGLLLLLVAALISTLTATGLYSVGLQLRVPLDHLLQRTRGDKAAYRKHVETRINFAVQEMEKISCCCCRIESVGTWYNGTPVTNLTYPVLYTSHALIVD